MKRPQVLGVFHAKPTPANLRAYEKALEDANWIAKKLRPCMQFVQFHLLHDAGDKALFGRDGWFFYRPGVEYVTRRPPAVQRSREPAAIPCPPFSTFEINWRSAAFAWSCFPCRTKRAFIPNNSPPEPLAAPVSCAGQTRSLLDRARAAGVEVIDMFGAFARAKRLDSPGAEPLYLAQDSHWSPAGVRQAARWVADWLVARGWVERGVAESQVSRVPLARLGDVLRMLQSPQIESGLQPESMTCEKVLPGSGASTRDADNDAAQVLILGDSFLRIFQNDEPGSAGFISHLAKELKQPVASIVSDGGASTMVRQELYRRPRLLTGKKVVIWEFVERDIRFGTEGWQIIPLPPAAGSLPRRGTDSEAGGPVVDLKPELGTRG